MSKTRIISKAEVVELLSMSECIAAMEETLQDISTSQAVMLQRSMIPHASHNTLAIMPSSLLQRERTGAKVIIFSKKETAQGIVPLFDTESGALLAIVDATHITVLRTAATSAAATRHLANEDATTLGILGAGRLGRMHIEAMLLVRGIKCVFIWDRDIDRARALAEQTRTQYNIEAEAVDHPKAAVCDSDIVCTVTSASEYFLEGSWLKPGTHLNAVGACSAAAREIDAEAVKRSLLFTDQTEAVLKDGGDVLLAIAEGAITADHIVGEIGSVMLGTTAGRQLHEEITLFESVGIAVEDIAAVDLIYRKAIELGVGIDVEF